MSTTSINIKKRPQRTVQTKDSDSNGERGYLAVLGERVREARAKRGISRKLLARDSGVSERYLAQLEGGHGNVSILLLRQIAAALNIPLAELLAEDPDEAVELTLTTQFLKRLPRHTLAAVRSRLVRDYGSARDERMKVIAQGDTRPMAGNDQAMEDLRRILEGRAALYGQADVTVDTARNTPEQSLSALRKAVAT